jgi:hypothetical protein
MTIIIKIRKLPMICDEGNHQWVTSGLTWGTLIITMDITKTKIINSMWKMCWAVDVLRRDVGLAHPVSAATPFSYLSKSIYKTLRKSGEHGE